MYRPALPFPGFGRSLFWTALLAIAAASCNEEGDTGFSTGGTVTLTIGASTTLKGDFASAPAGYTAYVNDRGATSNSQDAPVGPNGSVSFEVGYQVPISYGLRDLTYGCGSPSGGLGVSTGVITPVRLSSATTTVYDITCWLGSIEVSVTTTGDDLDADGYEVAIGRANGDVMGTVEHQVPLDVQGTTVVDAVAGGRTVIELRGVASNCTVPDAQLVDFAADRFTGNPPTRLDIDFAVACQAGGAGSVIEWDNDSGDGRWLTAENWVGDVLPGPTDRVLIDDPTEAVLLVNQSIDAVVVRDLEVTAGTVVIWGGELQVTGTAQIAGGSVSVQWNQGQSPAHAGVFRFAALDLTGGLSCSTDGALVGGTATVGMGGTMTLGDCQWTGVQLTNDGSVLVDVLTELSVDASTDILNRGELTVRESSVACADASCSPLVNEGQLYFTKVNNLGIETASILIPIQNDGSMALSDGIEVTVGSGTSGGTISGPTETLIATGPWTMDAGSSVSVGTLVFSQAGASSLQGTVGVDELEASESASVSVTATNLMPLQALRVSGAAVTLATGADAVTEVVDLSGDGTLTVEAGTSLRTREAFRWRAGTLNGAGETIVEALPAALQPALLTFFGDGAMNLEEQLLAVEGQGRWEAGDISAGGGATLRIGTSSASQSTTVLELLHDGSFVGDARAVTGAPNTSFFHNYGTLEKVGGAGGSTVIRACYQDGGVGATVGAITIDPLACS